MRSALPIVGTAYYYINDLFSKADHFGINVGTA